jgi:hypothetical protein
MCAQAEQAIDLYNKAYHSEQEGKANLAEVYYLKSWSLFEQAGGTHYLNAANALNALAFLRWSRKDYEGALCSARKSVRIMESYGSGFISADANLIRDTAWELIDQISYEILITNGVN